LHLWKIYMSEQSSDLPVVLVVDDSKVIRRAAFKMLGDGYTVLEANDGLDAWQQLQQNNTISVVFTDLSMPNMDGIELLVNIRSSEDEHIVALPVIIMTGHGDTEAAKQEVFDKGATDFITKPFESIDLLSRAKSYAKLSRKVVELEMKTGYDKLTGLYNVSSFKESGGKALSFSLRHKLHITTAYFEIDDFQKTYLRHGKSIAQQILLTVSKRLESSMRSEDIAARIGVAKFAVLLPMTSQAKSLVVIGRIREAINKLVFDTGTEKIRASLSSGFSTLGQDDAIDFNEMMNQADDALLRAVSKTAGDKVVGYIEKEPVEKETVFSDEQLIEAASYAVQGDFYKLDDNILQPLIDKLAPFIDYVSNQTNADKTPG